MSNQTQWTKQMYQEEMENRRNYYKKIVESGKENMANFIPRNAAWQCQCKNHNQGTVTCKVYPNGIPKEILCGEFCKDRIPPEQQK